jgi:hypothetical protein
MTQQPELSPEIMAAVTAAVEEINSKLHHSARPYTVEDFLARYQGKDLDAWLIYRDHHPVYKEEK